MPTDDPLQRIAALEKQIARLEQELAEVRLSGQRLTVQQALMDERLLMLERNRLFRLWSKVYRTAARTYSRIGIGRRFGGLSDLRTPGDYQRFCARQLQEMDSEERRAPASAWPSQPLISVEIPAGAGARESIRSVLDQSYPNFELCLPADLIASVRGEVEPRRVAEKPSGDFELRLHAGDRLSPHALYFYAQALAAQAVPTAGEHVDVLYADEDTIDGDGNRIAPLFKPGWSPELLRSTMYLGRAVLYRRPANIVRPITAETASNLRVRRVPRVLYHRMASTPPEYRPPRYDSPADTRLAIIICTRQIRQLRECLEAIRYTASLSIELLVVHHLHSDTGEDLRRCVEQFGGEWIPYRGPFDFARMNNLAAAKAKAPYLLFLNDDVIVHERGWDYALASTLARPDVGIAGAILQYPNGAIQHAGVVTGMGDAAGHCGRFQMSSDLWPWLRMSRDVTAVTGAMLAIRSELYQRLQGFDGIFPVNYNDVDLCLRVKDAGLRVVCLDAGKVVHKESQTRIGGTQHDERDALYRRWPGVLSRADEYYSPHLAPMERIALSTEGRNRNPLEGLG